MRHRERLLSASEEIGLAKQIQRGDRRAKQQMIESNLRLVSGIARSYRASPVPYEDLVQEGTVGLIQAVERFDYGRGLRFSTYAGWWIRRSMLDAIADAQVIRIPAKAKRHLAAIRRAEAELKRTEPRRASDAAIAERTGLSAVTVQSLRGAARVTASLDQATDKDATPLGEVIADDRIAAPSDFTIAAEDRREIAAMLRLLPERHRQVVVRRYGLDGHRVETHQEIGACLGVGEERSRQIEREALRRLRAVTPISRRAA